MRQEGRGMRQFRRYGSDKRMAYNILFGKVVADDPKGTGVIT